MDLMLGGASRLLLVAACVGLCAPAKAGDWLVTSHVGQSVELNDNPQQLPDSPGGAVGSITNFSLNAINELPTLRFDFGTDLAWRAYTGPGAQSSLDGLQGDVEAGIKKSTKLTDYRLAGSWQRQPAAVSELIDSGILAANTTRTTYFATGGLEHHLNSLNSLGWSASGTSVDFSNDDAGLTPFNDVSMSGAWIRNISPATSFTTSADIQWFVADNLTDTESLIQTVTGQIDTQLTSRLKFMGRAGGGVVRTTERLPTPRGRHDISDTSGKFVAAAELAYELKNTTISASASHDFAPSSLGEVQDRTVVGFLVDHKINERSSLLFEGQFFDQRPSTSTPGESNHRQAMILTIAYSLNLMRDWDMHLRYRFVTQDENTDIFSPFDDGSSTSNALFVTVTRNINWFGNPGG